MPGGHFISLFLILIPAGHKTVSENVQHNDLIVLSRKILVSWSICIAMVEDTMGIDTIMQRELIK